jgi:hypothetical protein
MRIHSVKRNLIRIYHGGKENPGDVFGNAKTPTAFAPTALGVQF